MSESGESQHREHEGVVLDRFLATNTNITTCRMLKNR